MQTTMAKQQASESTSGIFKYMDASAQPSLYRNGKVFTRRDKDGSDGGWQGVSFVEQRMTVHNARLLQNEQRCTVVTNGFELLDYAEPNASIDFLAHADVVKRYYPQCEEIVRAATGAHVFAFDHNVRSASGKKSQQRIAGGQQVQGPAHVVHGDYTLTSAPQRLRDLTKPPGLNDTLRPFLSEGQSLIKPNLAERALDQKGRFAIINVWRNIAKEPVATHPLALCDAHSVRPEDLVVFEIHYQDRVGENYFAKHSAQHQWYYYPAIKGSEALLIKQWDSNGRLSQTKGSEGDAGGAKSAPCTFSFHSAFEDPATPVDAPDRWSIEVRCMVVYD
jgi:hypothetical protein